MILNGFLLLPAQGSHPVEKPLHLVMRSIQNNNLPQREISLWLDNYDDLFSDFDSRPYTSRIFSDDFIAELRRLADERDLQIKELKLLLPENLRHKKNEELISARLSDFFHENYFSFRRKRQRLAGIVVVMLVTGMACMLAAAWLSKIGTTRLIDNLFFVILEPAGWFLVWTGLDRLLSMPGKVTKTYHFYSKMEKCRFVFGNI